MAGGKGNQTIDAAAGVRAGDAVVRRRQRRRRRRTRPASRRRCGTATRSSTTSSRRRTRRRSTRCRSRRSTTRRSRCNASRYGANGRLVVTSVFSQGYTRRRRAVRTPTARRRAPPGDYDYIEVFSFSAPLDQDKRFISEGQMIDGFAGGVTEFNGLTEIGFPQTFVDGDSRRSTRRVEPAPVKFDADVVHRTKIILRAQRGRARSRSTTRRSARSTTTTRPTSSGSSTRRASARRRLHTATR